MRGQRTIPGISFWNGPLKFLSRNRILIAEGRNGNIKGYAVTRRHILPSPPIGNIAKLYLFLSAKLSPQEAIAIFKKFANYFLLKGFREFDIFSMNINEKLLTDFSTMLGKNFGLRIFQYLVCIKTLLGHKD